MRKEPTILAIVQGTTNSKIFIVDSPGAVIREASQPIAISYPQPGWVEKVQSAIQDALQGFDPAAVAAVAVTNQRESALLWERETGKPLAPCVT